MNINLTKKYYQLRYVHPAHTMFKLGYDYRKADTKEKKTEIQKAFMKFLDSLDGWDRVPIEGGYISSDSKTIIWYDRSPYDFQIGPYTARGTNITMKRIYEFEEQGLI